MNVLIEKIDSVLPQTQCGLCSYNGCRPYAAAIALQHETIDRCPPGGVKTLLKLSEITGQDATSYISEMEKKAKPPMLAVIREDECIGCTKCIQACPVDAIVGAAKQMHTIIAAECTGCELCVKPCPVDCIDMITLSSRNEIEQQHKAELARNRYEFRNQRLEKNLEREKLETKQKLQQQVLSARKAEIQAAVARAKAKRGVRIED